MEDSKIQNQPTEDRGLPLDHIASVAVEVAQDVGKVAVVAALAKVPSAPPKGGAPQDSESSP